MPPIRPISCAALWLVLLAGCAATPPARPDAADDAGHHTLNAVLWTQRAIEFEAVVRGAFAAATRQLDAALADPHWDALPPDERAAVPLAGLPPAVIVDADETIIDNSAFQASTIRDRAVADIARRQAWTQRRAARVLPGALEFARAAQQRGVTLIVITNRRHPSELAATADNLRALGFPIAADHSNLMLAGDPRGAGHDKGARRRWVAQHYRVLLMLGDNLGDFLDQGGLGLAARDALAAPFADWWGERWIMLPNPVYGSWEGAVLRDCDPALRERPLACRQAMLRHD